MTLLATALRSLAFASAIVAFAGCGYLLLAILAVRKWPRRIPATGQRSPGVSILKPLHGDEAGLERRLLSFAAQHYDGPVQIVFGCQDVNDPARSVAQRIAVAGYAATVEIVVDERLHGSNRKVSNLMHCYEHAWHDVLVLADSDIEVGEHYLRAIVEVLHRPGVGAVTCLYEGEGEAPGARLSAQAVNAHFIPNVLAGMALGAATPCFGSTVALRRDVLERIGGLRALVDKLADDYAIGEAVRHLGLEVAVLPFTVRHACAEPTIAAFFAHQLRFARTIRSIDPRGHVGSLVTNPLPLALFAALGRVPYAWTLVAAALICRSALLQTVARHFGMARQRFQLVPFCDLSLFVVFLVSFCGSTVEWRGHRFRSRPDGSLVAKKDLTPA